MALTFSIKLWCKWHHLHKKYEMHAAMDGIELPCERDINNAHDPICSSCKTFEGLFGGVDKT